VFVIPFEGEVMVGTTDDEYRDLEKEPILIEKEVEFLLETLERFLAKKPQKHEIKAGFGGLRPLIGSSGSKSTKKLVRDHEVEHDEESNLISLLGGKWTTYRLMAKDTIDEACQILGKNVDCSTENHLLVGAENYDFEQWKSLKNKYNLSEESAKHLTLKYGSRAGKVLQIAENQPDLFEKISKNYPFIKAEVIYTTREEMACTLRFRSDSDRS
nr:FAD-dependent oxidoreductase [Spirosomataceae bacterium]